MIRLSFDRLDQLSDSERNEFVQNISEVLTSQNEILEQNQRKNFSLVKTIRTIYSRIFKNLPCETSA